MTDLHKLIDAVRSVAPKLCPDFYNKNISETLSSLDQSALKKKVAKVKKTAKSCSLCCDSLTSTECSVVVDYAVEEDGIVAKALTPICPKCLSVKDLASIFQLVTAISARPANKKNEEKLVNLATHFLKVNGHDLSNSQAFQSAITQSFTLSLLCKDIPASVVSNILA